MMIALEGIVFLERLTEFLNGALAGHNLFNSRTFGSWEVCSFGPWTNFLLGPGNVLAPLGLGVLAPWGFGGACPFRSFNMGD